MAQGVQLRQPVAQRLLPYPVPGLPLPPSVRPQGCAPPDLQRVNGTARQLYGADIVLVVTNGRFSTRCAPLAAQLHMHLADRRTLATWASDGRPLWELLPKIPPPRKGR